jgi:hypothetical protein
MRSSIDDPTQWSSTYIKLVFDNRRYYEEYDGDASILDIWRTLKDKIAAGEKPAEPDQTSLQMKVPSHVGSTWDPESDSDPVSVESNGGMYCWCVEKTAPLKTGTQIGKFSIPQDSTEYSIAFRTASEDTTRTFVPGIGFTARIYALHAKLKYTDEHLVEFHPANP